jgi:hypothetical protein
MGAMNTDLNHAIQDRLKRNRRNRNRHRLLIALCLSAVLVTSTVLTSPAVALTGNRSDEVVQETRDGEAAVEQNSDGQPAGSMAKATPASLENAPAEETTEEAADETTADADAVELENDLANGQTEAGAADGQGDLLFEDGLMKITASRKDGGSFPSGMTLGEEEFDEIDAAAAERFLQDTITKTDTENVNSSIAGLHTFELTPEGEADSEDAEDGKIVFTAKFPGGLNDAGYASKAEQSVEKAEDGTSTTQTTKYRTSWRIYLVSEDGLTDITDDAGIPLSNDVGSTGIADEGASLPSADGRTEIADDGASLPDEDDFTDITDDDETSLTTDNTGACTGVTFTGKLPEKVVLAQIVRKTVTTASVEEQMPQSAFSFDERVLTEKGSIRVQVEADEGTFDEGTTMTVTPVSSSDILDKAIDAAGGKGAAAAVDIAFTKPDGTQTEPAKPIRVKMTSAVLSRADEAHVVHVDDSGNTDVVAKKTDGQTVESTNGEAVGTDASNAVSFESDSFSVYAIVYTVDFTYSNYAYSIEGGSSILLSSLAQELGLRDIAQSRDFAIEDVDDVTFSDSSLVSVTKQDGDFVLTSLKPFTSTEKLTILMKDGSKYEVEVKDAQEVDFGQYITSVDTYKKNNGNWEKTSSIQDGDNVKFVLNFQIFSDNLSNEQKRMTYTMDSHIAISQYTPLTLYEGTTKVGTGIVDTDGKITINWEDSYDISKGFKGSIMFEGTAHSSGSTNPVTVKFGDQATISINPKSVPSNNDISLAKTGNYQTDGKGNHYIRYEVIISTTNGTGGSFNFTDSMSANGIAAKYDLRQIWVYKNGTTNSVSVTPYINSEDKLEIDNLPELGANENYHVIYCVPVNENNIDSSDGSASVSNSCHAWNNNVNGWGGTWTKIQDAVIQKTGSYDANSGKMKWTITVNNPDRKNLSGVKLTDVLSVTNGDGSKVTLPKSFTIKGSDGDEFIGSFGADGSYTFPLDSYTADKYTIEYETTAPAGTAGTTSNVKNTITYRNQEGKVFHTDSGDIGVYHPTYNVQKYAPTSGGKTDEGEKLQWVVRIDLPDGDLDLSKLTYTDTMTGWNKTTEITGKHFTTPALLNEAILWSEAGGLEAGTDYQLQTLDGKTITGSTSTEKLAGFKIQFMDAAKTKLKGQKCFSLRYDTVADETEQPAGSTWTFKNKAAIPDHESETSYDNKKPNGDLVKQVSLTDERTSYSSDTSQIEYSEKGMTLYYKVLIHLNKNSSGNQTIVDVLPSGMKFGALNRVVYFDGIWEQYDDLSHYNGTLSFDLKAHVAVKSEQQADGSTKMTFTLSDGYERPYTDSYCIAFYYTATINDPGFWGDLHNTEKEYTNEAIWGNLNSDVTTKVKHTVKNLDKAAQLSDVEGTNGEIKKAAYYLTINPLGNDLVPGADTITLSDQLSCDKTDVKIQFHPESLKVFAYDGTKPNHCGDEINQNRYGFSYDEQQHSLELKLPDETPCVVYYEYYVIPGLNPAGLSNSASLSGVANSSTDNQLSLSASTASGLVTKDELNVYKVDSENYRIKLQGVTFDLYQYQFNNNTPSWMKVDSTKMKDKLETDQNGRLYLNLTDDNLEQGCLYKLLETGVGNNTTYQFDRYKGYYFIWATDDDIKQSRTDQQIWDSINGRDKSDAKQEEVNIIRHSGAIYVPNENTGITINKVWLNADHSDDKNPGEATVTLYRQARQPGGVKVTVNVCTQYQSYYSNEVYIKSGTPVSLLIDTNWDETYLVDGRTEKFHDGKDHTLELGSPTKDTTYTVVASYWSTQKVKDLYYTPTDQFTNCGDQETIDTYTLNKDNNYSVTVGNLPLRDDKDNKYYYWVAENEVPHYTTSYSKNNGKIQKGTITVTNTRESVTVTGTKAWKNGKREVFPRTLC